MTPKFDPVINCPECGGTGKKRLPTHLASVLRIVRANSGITRKKITDRLPSVTSNAVNSRLETLVNFGLVERTPKVPGSPVTYSATSTTKGGK